MIFYIFFFHSIVEPKNLLGRLLMTQDKEMDHKNVITTAVYEDVIVEEVYIGVGAGVKSVYEDMEGDNVPEDTDEEEDTEWVHEEKEKNEEDEENRNEAVEPDIAGSTSSACKFNIGIVLKVSFVFLCVVLQS